MVEITENNGKTEEKPMEIENTPKIFTVEILHLIKEAQQQHGLRHHDYQRYRGYCTRRVRRLRKVLKLPQGEKRHYRKRDVTVANLEGKKSDVRYLHIPLIMAERAWSYAMQLRQESNTEPRKRYHLVNKLRRACVYSLQLQELCNTDVCDARTKLEAEAYVAWMHGTLYFELSSWQTAAENFKKSQLVYENLLKALPEEEQGIYKAKLSELEPSLRFCAYNSGASLNIDELLELRAQGILKNLDSLVNQTKSQSSETLQTIEWRSRKVTVRPEKVRLFLLSIQELDKSLAKTESLQGKIELIENSLIDCKDAITAVRDEIKQDPKLRQTTDGSGGTGGPLSGIQYLLAYLSYIRMTRTLERNLLLVAQAKQNLEDNTGTGVTTTTTTTTTTTIGAVGSGINKKIRPQDLTRLYEIILQNVSELQQIGGMEEDVVYQKEIEILSLSFKAFRCYYIAQTLVAMKRWKESVAMYGRSVSYAHEALKSKSKQFNLETELMGLIKTIEGSKFSAHAYSVLEDDNTTAATDDSTQQAYSKSQKLTKPLFERLSQYREDAQLHSKTPNVYKLTPDMEPIPCKPLFFDLALNFIEFPSLDDKIDTAAMGAQKGTAGLSGFVKGFLGWGGDKK